MSVSILVKCDSCGAKKKVGDHRAGMRIRCPECQEIMQIPWAKDSQKKTPSNGKSETRIRAVIYSLLAVFVAAAIWEFQARRGYNKSLENLQVAFHREEAGNDLYLKDIQNSIHGWPSKTEYRRAIVYTWTGTLDTYRMKVDFGLGGLVVGLETTFDEESLTAGEAIAEAPAPRSPNVPNEPSPTKTPAPKPDSKKLAEALAESPPTGNTIKSSQLRLLRRMVDHIPEVTVSTEIGKPQWHTFEVNKHGAGMDAIRFRSPLDVAADMYWVFVTPADKNTGWQIIEAEAYEAGLFRTLFVDKNLHFDSVELPLSNAVIAQPLTGGVIKPGKEYIIYFTPTVNEPVKISATICLQPAGMSFASNGYSASQIIETMGLVTVPPDFSTTPKGVREAVEYAQNMLDDQNYAEFENAIAAVGSTFPALKSLDAPGKTPWKELRSYSPESRFAAVKFQAPETTETVCEWGLVTENNLEDWGIVSLKTAEFYYPRHQGYRVRLDVRSESAEFPERNIGIFQSIAGLALKPREEYVLWFRSSKETPISGRVAVNFQEDLDATGDRQLVSRLGIENTNSNVSPNDAIARARHLVINSSPVDVIDRILLSAVEGLPALKPSAKRGTLNWQKIDHRQVNTQLAALKVESPLDVPGQAILLIAARNADVEARIVSASSTADLLLGKSFSHAANGIESVPSIDGGSRQLVAIPVESSLSPNEQFLIWFKSNDELAADVDVALFVRPITERQSVRSFRASADIIGLSLPVAPATAGSFVLGEHRDNVTAVAFSKDGQTVLSGGRDGVLNSWDLEARSLIGDQDLGLVLQVIFHPGEKYFAVSEDSQRIFNGPDWNPESQETSELDAPTDYTRLSPSGELRIDVTYGRPTSRLLLHDERGDQYHLLEQETNREQFRGARFTPNEEFLVTYHTQNRTYMNRTIPVANVRVWKTDDFSMVSSSNEMFAYPRALAISPDGKKFCVASHVGIFTVYEIDQLRVTNQVALSTFGWALAFSDDGTRVVIGCDDLSVREWDLATDQVVTYQNGHSNQIHSVAISPDGRWIASGGEDGTVRIIDKSVASQNVPLKSPTKFTNSIGMELNLIPPGEFQMGSNDGLLTVQSDVQPVHSVVIGRPFYIGKHEVTVAQFQKFVDQSGYLTQAEKEGGSDSCRSIERNTTYRWNRNLELNWQNPGIEQDPSHPVIHVSWNDAREFCKWLSKQESKSYRLPTEAEWEYACRAGSQSEMSFKLTNESLALCVNIADPSLLKVNNRLKFGSMFPDNHLRTAPVDSGIPNAFGLYNMHGNAAEWCQDWYDSLYYTNSGRDDPQGPETGQERSIRGGFYYSRMEFASSSARDSASPDTRRIGLGFRVVCTNVEKNNQE